MSDSHGGSGLAAFPAADWEQFHQDDKSAAAAVVVLMSLIFSMGLILYTLVALWVY